jgi:hypothetical protein
MAKLKITVEVNGRKIDYVNVDDMTLDELTLLKNVSQMSPVEVETRRWQGDPDAWRGLLAVAIKRKRPDADVDEVMAELGRTKLYPIYEAILEALEKASETEGDASPPDEDAERKKPGSSAKKRGTAGRRR